MLQCLKFSDQIDSVINFIREDDFLNPHVLDAQAIDEVLVVLTDSKLPDGFVQGVLQRVWSGPVETHCATDVMIGC